MTSARESDYRPLGVVFNPVDSSYLDSPKLLFSPALTSNELKYYEAECIPIRPDEKQVAWITSLPGCKQSKHRNRTVTAVREFLESALQSFTEPTTIPSNDHDYKQKASKLEELVDTAASCASHHYPSASPEKVVILAQFMVLFWLHDGKASFQI